MDKKGRGGGRGGERERERESEDMKGQNTKKWTSANNPFNLGQTYEVELSSKADKISYSYQTS